MDMLFAPKTLFYLSFKDGNPFQLVSKSGKESKDKKVLSELSNLNSPYKWSDFDQGFLLQIKIKGNVLGAVKIEDLAFPEYKQHYLNLSLFLIDICGLTISNARNYQVVQDQRKQLIGSYNDLKESERKVSTLLHNLPGAAYRCNNDDQWTMKYLSNGIKKISGYTAEELIDNNKISYFQL